MYENPGLADPETPFEETHSVTKASPNPRRYSRGPEGLDPNQQLNVYLSLSVLAAELQPTIDRVEYLASRHPDAIVELAGYRREGETIHFILEVNMGPARSALRGATPHLQAGYSFLWDAVKTLFYSHPVFTNPPTESERARVNLMGENHPTRFGVKTRNEASA